MNNNQSFNTNYILAKRKSIKDIFKSKGSGGKRITHCWIQMLLVIVAFTLVAGRLGMAAMQAPSVHNINKDTMDYSIQEAINDASPGDEIHVDSGTYYENVVVNKRLILRGIDNGGGKPVVDAGGSGSAITLDADGITLCGFTATNAGSYAGISYPNAGIKVISSNNTLIGNTASNNSHNGIMLDSSSNNILSGNTASNNLNMGIHLHFSSNNTLSGNTASNNFNPGIGLLSSCNNTLIGNIALNTRTGIYLHSSSNNTLNSNTASNQYYGIVLLSSSNNNTIIGNTASDNNYYGIWLDSSSSNILYHNNLVDNTNYNAYDYNGSNQWDSGSEGNYYSDYTGTDSDGDSIGDTPYPIPGGSSMDRYPLMVHVTPGDASLVAEWHFDEGSGNLLIDSSGNGNDGIIYGAAWTTEGKFGSALQFDGIMV